MNRSNRKYVPLIAMALVTASSVHAASFDCKKAVKPQEKLICSSPEVNRLDSELSSSYKDLLQRLSTASQNDVRRSQREWLAFWPNSCRVEGEPLNPKSKDTQSCAIARYKDRIALLKGPDFVTGDIPLYPVSTYSIRPSTAEVEWVKFAQSISYYPAVDLEHASHEKKNLALLIDRWLRKDMGVIGAKGDDSSDSETGRYFVKTLPMLLSTSTSSYFFGHGAAHPVSGFSMQHFYLPDARPMRASDVFQGGQWQDGLTVLVEKQLRKELADGYYLESRAELKKLVIDPARWQFDGGALTVSFNQYEVAAYAAGSPSVTIPWSGIKPWLTPQVLQSVSVK